MEKQKCLLLGIHMTVFDLSSGSHLFCFKSCFSCFLQSIVAFLKDPEGAPLWEEDPEAKDIVHVDSEKV